MVRRDCKLYGGQQMDRLLAEFRTIADHLYLRVSLVGGLAIRQFRLTMNHGCRITSSTWKTWPPLEG
jgi:hypothetical protein